MLADPQHETAAFNLGVRYDLTTNAWANDVAVPPLQEAGRANDTNNIQPRVGFAWQLNDKTVVRGGYGLYFNTNSHQNLIVTVTNPPATPRPVIDLLGREIARITKMPDVRERLLSLGRRTAQCRHDMFGKGLRSGHPRECPGCAPSRQPQRRPPSDLYHSALVVTLPSGRYVVEQTPAVRDREKRVKQAPRRPGTALLADTGHRPPRSAAAC